MTSPVLATPTTGRATPSTDRLAPNARAMPAHPMPVGGLLAGSARPTGELLAGSARPTGGLLATSRTTPPAGTSTEVAAERAPLATLRRVPSVAMTTAGKTNTGLIRRDIIEDPESDEVPKDVTEYEGAGVRQQVPQLTEQVNLERAKDRLPKLTEEEVGKVLADFLGDKRHLVYRSAAALSRWITFKLGQEPVEKSGESGATSTQVPDLPGHAIDVASGTFGPTRAILVEVLSYLSGTDTLSARLVSRAWNSLVIREARGRLPYPDFTRYALLNQYVFPTDFAKGNFTDAPMTKPENLRFSWTQYQQTVEGKENLALVMRIVETNTFRQLQSGQAEAFEEQQVIFRPATPGKWSPQVDDSWILAHLHKQSTILMMCDVTNLDNFWDRKAKRVTATGREVLLALRHGYRAYYNNRAIQGITGGVLLLPTIKVQDTGLLPSDLTEVDKSELEHWFPRGPGNKAIEPVEVRGEGFSSEVSAKVDEAIEKQASDAKKNFLRLPQRFNDRVNNGKALETQINTCISMLSPDSHIIPYDRQDEFREGMRQWWLHEAKMAVIIPKGTKKDKILEIQEEYARLLAHILLQAQLKSGVEPQQPVDDDDD